MADRTSDRGGHKSAPSDELSEEFRHLLSAVAERVLGGANDRLGSVTDRLTGLADGDSSMGQALGKASEKKREGKSPVMAGLAAGAEGVKSKLGNAFKGGGGGGGESGNDTKVTNIIEEIDIGAPIELVYDQWTQFQDFSHFMKKVENVDQEEDQKLSFKAQVLWSHRTWESTIIEQVPDSRIIWRSRGEKGRVDGAVTFHEIAPDLTRVLVVLEYHPQGLFERTGNLWRAQGRRVRLELKHFRRHVMSQALLHPDDVQGWRGEIHDSDVTKSDEDARAEQESDQDEAADSDESDEEFVDESDDGEYEPTDEAEYSDESEDEEDESEDEEDYEDEEEEDDEEEDDEGDQEPPPTRRPRRRAQSGGNRR